MSQDSNKYRSKDLNYGIEIHKVDKNLLIKNLLKINKLRMNAAIFMRIIINELFTITLNTQFEKV
jgi:hypothetical protein